MKNTTESEIAETPERKFIGFYYDSDGEMQVLEEGLSKTERLALLNFAERYCRIESDEVAEANRKRIKSSELAS